MEDKSRLLVFNKKEVFLIFIFMIVIALTSFTIGVRIGKNYAFKGQDPVMEDDAKALVEMRSAQEEIVDKTVVKHEKIEPQEREEAIDETYKELEEEFSEIKKAKKDEKSDFKVKMEELQKQKVEEKPVAKEVAEEEMPEEKMPEESLRDKFTGKYTIQLASYQLLEDAEKFAEAFKVRGYNPIINEKEIEGRGTWYRVSLGIFESYRAATDYIQKEESLFHGQDHDIKKFD